MEDSNIAATGATRKKSGCGCLTAVFYFLLGIILLQIVGAFLSVFSR
jgi:hypothetical protein